MAYSLVQLQAYFKNANGGVDPTAAQNQGLLAIVNANAAGGSDTIALQQTLDLASDTTTAVSIQTYQFFLGFAPSAEGLAALNKAYTGAGAQANLNGENRYIAQSVSLALQNSTAKTAFAAAYGSLSQADAATQAYNVIVGSAAAAAAGINVPNAVAFLTSAASIAYYTAFVKANVPGIADADVALAVKAAIVGEIIYQATIFGGTASGGPGVGSYSTVTTNLIKDLADDGVLTFNNVAGIDLFGSYGVKQTPQTFVLTDKADATTGGSGDDIFIGTNTTVSAADVLQGGSGIDALQYSSSGAGAVVQAGFKSAGIEVFAITSDSVLGTTFDVSGSTDVNSLINDNSSSDLTLTGLNAVTAVTVRNTSAPVAGGTGTTNTTINYTAAAVAGATTTQAVSLENVFNPTTGSVGAATSSVTANGVEIFNVTGAGQNASHIGTLASNTLTTVNIDGAQGVQIDTLTFATNGAGTLTGTINGAKNTGGINVTIANSGAADTTVTGGTGNDRADFSNGFDAKDSFDGGTGTDTLVLNNATAIGAVAGKVTSVEVLEVSGGGTGTIDLSKFAGVNSVVYTSTGIGTGNSLVGATVISKATSTSTFTIDAGTVANTLSVATGTGTDTAADTTTININKVGAADVTGTITATDIETVNLTVADDTTVAGVGVLTIGAVTAAKATKVTLSSNADVVVTGATGGAALTSFDASASTGKVTLTGGVTTALSGAAVKLGAGDDTLTVTATAGTATGGDTITLGAGKDTVVYTTLAQSGDKTTDTITDFTSGTDKLDLTGVGLVSSAQFLGSRASFGLSQGALTKVAGQAVFQADTSTLWIDNGDGQLDASDFRIVLSGVTSLVNADLSLGTGATVNLTAPAAVVNTTTKTGASATTTNEADTITTTATNFAGSTINGGLGTDSLTVSGEAQAITSLVSAAGANASLTSVENVTFSQVTGVMSLTNQIGTDVKSITLSSANAGLTATTTADKQTITVSNTSGANGSTITLGAGAAGTNATVTLGAANDTVLATVANYVGGVFNAGTGTDILSLDGGTYDLSKASATTASIAGFETITLTGAGAASLTLAPDANLTINQNNAALTVASTGNTVTIVGTSGNNIVLSGSSNYVTSGSVAGGVVSTGTGTLSVTAAGGSQAVVSASATTINAAGLGAFTETLGGAGNFTVNGLGTIAGATVTESNTRTGALVVNLTGAGAATVTEVSGATGAATINHAGTGALALAAVATHGVTTINATAANAITVSGDGTIAYTATGAGNHSITSTTSGAAGDTIVASTNAASVDTISAGAGADKITISGGNDHLVLTAPAADTGIAVGINASAAVPANLQQINVSGMDIVTGFSGAADIATGLTTGANIVRNGGTTAAGTAGEALLLTGDYNSATGVFTVNTAGTSTLFAYDDNGTTAGGAYRGVVLVGYTDTGTADTWTAGTFAGVA